MKLTLERIAERRKYAEKVAARPGGECVIINPAELISLLDSARALARLEAWLRGGPRRMETFTASLSDKAAVTLFDPVRHAVADEIGPDLAAAIHQALDGAEVRE